MERYCSKGKQTMARELTKKKRSRYDKNNIYTENSYCQKLSFNS